MVVKTASVSATPGVSYVEWSAVFAGAVIALAISFIFLQFGGMIGLEIFEPNQAGDKTRGMVIAAVLWLFWVQLMSSMAGGYLAGRMRAPLGDATATESEVRDGAHGVLVWATATLVAVAAGALGSALAHLGHVDADVHKHAEIAENLAKNSAIIFGFGAAAGSLVSAAAAAWMGTIGGEHRNQALRFQLYTRKK